MGLSAEANAIVASNLTAAHCALVGFRLRPDGPIDGNAAEKEVRAIFASYLRQIAMGQVSHDPNPSG